MKLGTLTQSIDESYFYKVDQVLGEVVNASIPKNISEDEFKNLGKFQTELNDDLTSGKISQKDADIVGQLTSRIAARAEMVSKTWIDKMLLQLKRFAHKLEGTPKNAQNAGFLAKIKSFIGTAIRKLTNVLMKVVGTNKRKGKVTLADRGVGYKVGYEKPIWAKDKTPGYTNKVYRPLNIKD